MNFQIRFIGISIIAIYIEHFYHEIGSDLFFTLILSQTPYKTYYLILFSVRYFRGVVSNLSVKIRWK